MVLNEKLELGGEKFEALGFVFLQNACRCQFSLGNIEILLRSRVYCPPDQKEPDFSPNASGNSGERDLPSS